MLGEGGALRGRDDSERGPSARARAELCDVRVRSSGNERVGFEKAMRSDSDPRMLAWGESGSS